MPSPEDIRSEVPDALRKALEIMRGYSKEVLINIRKTLNHWEWHPALGKQPENWEHLPNYKKPWMPDNTATRDEYIRQYMLLLELLGITHWAAYDL